MCLGGAFEFCAPLLFASGVEPFLPPLEELVVCEHCVWELLRSICIAFFCASLAFGMAYVS
jgi:hypothetical protein